MDNLFLVIILGLALILSSFGMNYAKKSYTEYNENLKLIENIKASDKNVPDSHIFEKYSLESLKKNYPSPKKIFEKTTIDVPVINQYPELPVGCEAASATALLNYLGINVDKMSLYNNYFETDSEFVISDDGVKIGPDPNVFFIGDATSNGLGCYEFALEKFINNYFAFNGYNYNAIGLENLSQHDFETLLENGIPVIVWASQNMQPYQYNEKNRWILKTTGEEFFWLTNSHVLVAVGYDQKNYYFSDSNDKKEIVKYRKTDFLKRWQQLNSKALIVKK